MTVNELEDKELKLFLDLSRWLVLKTGVAQRSRSAWLSFFLAHCDDKLSSEVEHSLREAFKVDHPIFINGEEALCLVAQNLHHSLTARITRTSPTRHTDWGKTMASNHGGVMTRFIEKPRKNRHHQQMLSALLVLANDQLTILEAYEDYKNPLRDRITRLRAARRKLEDQLPRTLKRNQKFTKEIRHHLHTEYPEYAGRVTSMLHFLHDKLDPETDRDAFESFCKNLAKCFQAENSDHLLEVISRLAIARAAFDQGFTKITKLITETRTSRKELTLEMKNDVGKVLVIGKGRNLLGSEEGKYHSKLKECGRAMGDNPSGLEPDICIKLGDNFFLGDAKRNPTGDGRNYRASSIKACASYLHEYEVQLKGSIPAFTLFFLQGGEKIAGKSRDEIKEDRNFPNCENLPIIGLGLDKDDFEGKIIRIWFEKLLEALPYE